MSASTPNQLKAALWSALRQHETSPVLALAATRAALSNGASPNDGYGTWVPLGWAIRNKAPDLAICLIDAGADINTRENNKSMLGRCLITPGMDRVAKVLIERGVKPTGGILRTAAKCANEPILRWAMEAGVDPNDLNHDQETRPAILYWPAKTPLPDILVRASLHRPLGKHAGQKIATLVASRKNKALLSEFTTHAIVSEAAKFDLLCACVRSTWAEGVDHLLRIRYCNPQYRDRNHGSILPVCAPWISRKSSRRGLEVLSKLLDYGYDINAVPDPLPGQNQTPTPDAFLLFRNTSHKSRAALLSFLIDRGMRPVFMQGQVAQTLAHTLIACNEWRLLAALPNRYPAIQWEQDGAPGLLITWALKHANPTEKSTSHSNLAPADPPEPFTSDESLDIVQSLPGFDWQKRTTQGHSGLRLFMQRRAGANFTQITSRLMSAGISPYVPDSEGLTDIDYLDQVPLARGLRETFLGTALSFATPDVPASQVGTTRRL